MMNNCKAIVLGAGKGKRLGSESSDLPKVMRLVNAKALLHYVLGNIDFIEQKDITVVVGYKKESVIESTKGEYNFAIQQEQLGTGHATKSAKEFFEHYEGDVLVCYGDMPLLSRETFENIVDIHQSKNADCTVLTAINNSDENIAYGRIIRNSKTGMFMDVVEQKDCSDQEYCINELNIGVYVFKSKALFSALDELKNNNTQGEYYLTDVPKLLLNKGLHIETCTTNNVIEIHGVNTPEDLVFCEQALKKGLHTKSYNEEVHFGTGGWRAIIADEFTKNNVCRLCQAISDYLLQAGSRQIVIGYDRRFLSDKAAMWASEVFAGNGITVYFINKIAPTPLVMYTVKLLGTLLGMAITASHNPAEYNGIKVFTEGGKDASAEITDLFEGILAKGVTVQKLEFEKGVKKGLIIPTDTSNEYMDSIIGMIDMLSIRKSHLKILLDPMFGVSKTTLQTILMTARCDVDIINDRHDALFGGRLPSPSAATLTTLTNNVVEKGYDLGIGTDGDADRIGIIDNNGKFIHPNEILVLLYYYMLKYKGIKGDVVRNIATTHLLDEIAISFGQKCHEVPVGFKHISSKMEETDSIIGGESSGGLTIKGHISGKDGIFASSLLVEMISVTGKKISQLLAEIYKQYKYVYMSEFDSKFSEETKQELMKLLFEEKKIPEFNREIQKISYADGCKVYFKDGGWIIARFSGTEPLIRIFCESESQVVADKTIGTMTAFLNLA